MPSSSPHAYADRLASEGAALAAIGAAGSVALLRTVPEARRWPHQTIGQLIGVTVLLLGPATMRMRRSLQHAPAVDRAAAGSGQPTPLHHLPVPVLASMVVVAPVGRRLAPIADLRRRAGWDAALRVTGGSLLVGLWQAVILRRAVREAEARRGATAVRLAGSRLGATRVGFVDGRD